MSAKAGGLIVVIISVDMVAGNVGIRLDCSKLKRGRRHKRLKGGAYGVKPLAGAVEKGIVIRFNKGAVILGIG